MPANLKNGAFCVLPFIEKHQSTDGKNYVCCYSNIPIDNATELKQKIYSGERIPHCSKCYDLDDRKSISPRLRESIQWLKDSEVKQYLDSWTPETQDKIFFYDLRIDNKCNLACIMCGPRASSLWAKELNIDIVKNPLKFDIRDCLTAKKIYLAGGEPLIIDEFAELLGQVSELEVQPEIVINTNLSNISDKVASRLSKIKNLTLTVSVDAYGQVNEYHRWPLKWNKFIDNLNWIRNNVDCTIQLNSVIDAVSIINVYQLIELEDLVDYWDLSLVINVPELCVNNLREDQKELIIENFKKIKQSKFYTKDPTFKSRVGMIIDKIKEPGDHFMLSSFLKNLDQRRNINHINYLGIDLT